MCSSCQNQIQSFKCWKNAAYQPTVSTGQRSTKNVKCEIHLEKNILKPVLLILMYFLLCENPHCSLYLVMVVFWGLVLGKAYDCILSTASIHVFDWYAGLNKLQSCNLLRPASNPPSYFNMFSKLKKGKSCLWTWIFPGSTMSTLLYTEWHF